ncbi:hypothetical protein D9M69_324280 [compost metagenome]
MYMVTTEARISSRVFDSDDSKASAAPRKPLCRLSGICSAASSARIASTASPSATPSARLKDTVAAGNCAMWLIASRVSRSSTLASADSRTWVPSLAGT